MNPQLHAAIAGAVVGGVIGIAGSSLTVYLSSAITKSKVASLLLWEVKANETWLTRMQEVAQSINQAGILHITEDLEDYFGATEGDTFDFYDQSPIVKMSPNTDIYSKTLQEQGLLRNTTIDSLQSFYNHIESTKTRWILTAQAQDRDLDRAAMIRNAKRTEVTAGYALSLLGHGEDTKDNLKKKLRAEKKWWNPFTPSS